MYRISNVSWQDSKLFINYIVRVWISPLFSKRQNKSESASDNDTGFKQDLLVSYVYSCYKFSLCSS